MIPFVVDGSQLNFCLFHEILKICCSHDGYFSFHFGSEDDIFDEIGDAIDGGFKIIDGGGLWFIEYLERLRHSEVY